MNIYLYTFLCFMAGYVISNLIMYIYISSLGMNYERALIFTRKMHTHDIWRRAMHTACDEIHNWNTHERK